MKKANAFLTALLAGTLFFAAGAAAEEEPTLVDLFYNYTKDNVIIDFADSNYLTAYGQLQKKSYDGFLALSQTDLDWDGVEELFAVRIKPKENGAGSSVNTLLAEVYVRQDNTLRRISQYTLADDILELDTARIDVFAVNAQSGQYICCEAKDTATMFADGISWSMRAAGFENGSFYEVSNAEMIGSAFEEEQMANARNAFANVGLDVPEPVWQPAADQLGLGIICTIQRTPIVDSASVYNAAAAGTEMEYAYTWFKNYMNINRDSKFNKDFAVAQEDEVTAAQTTSYSYAGDYVIPDSDSRYLTEDDLRKLSADEILLARNEIYAKHGRIFNNAALSEYFCSKSWYQPTVKSSDFTEDYAAGVFNDCEIKNILTMVKYEKDHGLNGYE